jgi:O-antigen/teichoic acid export membrane protein
MEPIKEYTRFTRQVSYVLFANIITVLLGFLQLPILTKGLGANLYGTWSLINATISLIAPFALLGFGDAILRFLAAEKDKGRIREDFLSALFSIVLVSGIAFALLLFFLSDYLAVHIFNDIDSSYYIKLASILVPLGCISGLDSAYLITFRKIGLLATFTVAQNAVNIGLIYISLRLGYQLTGVMLATIVVSLLFHLIILFIILKQIGFRFPRFSHLKSFLSFGLPLTPTSAILWVINSSDRYLISYFIGVAATGIYSAAYNIGWYASFLVTPITVLLFPTITKSYDENNLSETRNFLKYSFKYFMMIAIPSAFGLSILAKPLLQVLTTPEFAVGNLVVLFVAFKAVLMGLYEISRYIIQLVKKTRLILMLLTISAVLSIVLNILLIPLMGILGAAVASLVTYGSLFIITLIVTRRYLKFEMNLPFMLKSIFSSIIMAICIWLISPESIAWIIASIFIGIVAYFVVLLLIRGLSKEERTFFVNFLKDNLKLRKPRVIG